MVDITDSKLKQMGYKPWSAWNLPGCYTETDSVKLREASKPKDYDQCNLLPRSLMNLYGTMPEVEFFSVAKCPACKSVMKSQWMCKHFKRDCSNNVVCRRTGVIVNGNRAGGTAAKPLYDIREATKNALIDLESHSGPTAAATISSSSSSSRVTDHHHHHHHHHSHSQLSPKPKHSNHHHKTEHVSTSKSKSSSSSSHSKKHSSSSSSSSSRHRSSSSTSHRSNSSLSWIKSKDKDSGSSSKSHKSQHSSSNTGSYVLSIPSDDSNSHNDSVESLLMSNSSKTMHIVTGRSSRSSTEPEYEQLKFYSSGSEVNERRSRAAAAHAPHHHDHKIHFNTAQLENFKIPLKNKPSSASSSSTVTSNSESSKKHKSGSSHSSHSSSHHSSSSSKSSERDRDRDRDRSSFRGSSSSSSSSSSKPVPSLTIISEPPTMSSSAIPTTQTLPSLKDKEKEKSSSSHSKKKKKKKSKDGPRKVIPLKERAFNPDQHCGVTVSDGGHPCTRSLTCKTHSIALRRAVPGRSGAFDSLLAAHKKARDEEKAKTTTTATATTSSRDTEDSQTKGKKLGHSASTPITIDSDSSSSSLLQPPPTTTGGKGNPSSSNGTTKTSSATTSSSTSVQNGKQSGGANSTTHAKVGNSHHTTSQRHPPPQQQTAGASAKTTTKPVIIVQEKKESNGLSLFSVQREPENTFVYVGRIEPPKKPKHKELIALKNTPRINALSEWNPLDRLSRKGNNSKKKGFKEPLVALLSTAASGYNDTQLALSVVTTEGGNSTGSLETLKRKSSAADGSNRLRKRARLVSCPQKFYESLLEKPLQRRACTAKSASASTGGEKGRAGGIDPSKMTVVKTAVELIQNQLHELEYSVREGGDDRSSADIIQDSLSPEGREFLRNCVRAHSDKKDSVDKMSANEMFQHAFELTNTNRCILS